MRRSIPILAALAALAVTAPVAEATFKGHNGRLAYDIHQKGIDDDGSPSAYRTLSTVRPDGRADRFLRECQTQGPTIVDGDCTIDYLTPSWSRDAKRLVFDSGPSLALIGADGSGFVKLAQQTADDSRPVFAPSGRAVAFEGSTDGRADVFVLDLRTGNATKILRRAADPDWSSTNKIAFERSGSIYVADSKGRGAKRIARGSDPGWSATAKTLIYARRGGIYTVSAKGGKARRVVRCSPCSGPVFSPDSRSFAYDYRGPTIARLSNGRTITRPVRDMARGGESFDASNVSWGVR